MKNNLSKALIGGSVATFVMTLVMFAAPMMGLPKMDAAAMLSAAMNIPIALAWIMHFMIGIIFALAYVFLLKNVLNKINNILLRGAYFGFAAFIFAQIAMMMMGLVLAMPPMEGNLFLMMMGSVIGHLVFGITLAKTVDLKILGAGENNNEEILQV